MKKLIIAEKPSVAADISKALGGCTKYDDYFENDDYVISSAVGHLLEVLCPEEFEVKRGKWSLNHLPVIPPHFDIQPIVKTQSRLNVLLKLLKRKDVDSVINACDAGREGELIFRLIIQYAKSKKPIERLWLQSMTQKAIQEGFLHLKSDEDMQALADAARSRSEADWLIGINATRAMTAFNSQGGGFFLTTVGRVQTPTLSIMVAREQLIQQFVARPYWEIHAHFNHENIAYPGRWFEHQTHVLDTQKTDDEHKAWRIFDAEKAKKIIEDCQKNPSITASEQTKLSQQNPPLLYDLTSLQREANQRLGFSAKTTLSIAQSLYEKHKVITYPRTDSKHLPNDYLKTCDDVLSALEKTNYKNHIAIAKKNLPQQGNNPRIFDNSKVSDHFAIIPTQEHNKNLSEIEAKLYDMIVRRFIAAFYGPSQHNITTRITCVGEHHFKTEGKILVQAGWLAVYEKNLDDADDQLNPLNAQAPIALHEIAPHDHHTKPPARYNESTLLSAMETAGKHLEHEELRDAMQGKGLGTPATRASIIEGLITEKYIVREGKELMPTAKAHQLIRLLHGLHIDVLTKPELTGEWEQQLKQIEQKQSTRDVFMQGIARLTQELIDKTKAHTAQSIDGDYAQLAHPCPDCGGVVEENYRRFACLSCDFSFSKTPSGRLLDVQEANTLLKEACLGPLQGFRSKQNRPFMALLRLVKVPRDDKADLKSLPADAPMHTRMQFDFGQNLEGEDAPDFSGQTALGSCPKCQHAIFEHHTRYICEKSVGSEATCNFFSAKVILQQNIDTDVFQKILQEGKSPLLTGFKSARTGRLFKAYLVLQEGKIAFEFENKKAEKKADENGIIATPVSKPGKISKATSTKKTRKTTAPATSKTKASKEDVGESAIKTSTTRAKRTKKEPES